MALILGSSTEFVKFVKLKSELALVRYRFKYQSVGWLSLLSLEVDLGEDSEEVSFSLSLATAEVPDWCWLGRRRGVGAATEVNSLENTKLLEVLRLLEGLLRSWLRPRLLLLESLLRSGLRRSRLWSGLLSGLRSSRLWPGLLSGLRLLDRILLRLLLILDNLSLERLFPVDSLLDLIKETLGLGAAWVKCVGSWLWLLLRRLSLLHLWLLLLLRHKL